MKRTKIIATIGPATEKPEMISLLIKAGVNVFRQNFSHDVHEAHGKRIKNIRKVSKKLNMPVAILADLQGPKIRVGFLPDEGVELKAGQNIVLTSQKPEKGEIPVQYKKLPQDVSKGDIILLDDGKLELVVLSKTQVRVSAKVVIGGILRPFKGINLPTASVSTSALSVKDKNDLNFVLGLGVDYIALSFVQSAKDILNLRKVLDKSKAKIKPGIIAKVERHEAVKNIDEIIEAADAVMVARGDLGVELLTEKVPVIQKEIIKKSLSVGKPVIVATQMLESMIENPRPTRAEVSDIANAIIDGADAVMLSAETSVGKYPLEAVQSMTQTALDVEKWARKSGLVLGEAAQKRRETVVEAISNSAVKLAETIKSELLIIASATGSTAKQISKHRPSVPVMVITHSEEVKRKLALVWGVFPEVVEFHKVGELVSGSLKLARKKSFIKKDDLVVITSGILKGVPGGTNLIEVVKAD